MSVIDSYKNVDKEIKEAQAVREINKKILEHRSLGHSTKHISDGYHTFEELYFHRMILFSIICNLHPDKAWKSKLHSDGTMFGEDNFIVGITTPKGQYTYHYNLKHWDNFKVPVLDRAPAFDGHQPEDIDRLFGLLEDLP